MNGLGKNLRLNFLLFVFAGLIISLMNYQATVGSKVADLSYDTFQKYLREGRIKEVVIDDKQLKGTLRQPHEGKEQFVTTRVEVDLAKELALHNVTFSQANESSTLKAIVAWMMPFAMFLLFWIIFSQFLATRGGMSGGFMSVGKSKAKVYVEKDTKTSFDDVAGADEAKSELQEIVEFLKEPKSYGRLGARIPKGVLLVGPPGTGKTLLARAVAGEARVPFFTISGSEFVEMFVGVGAARVKDLFAQARSQSPCIIFIDELDALGRARATGPVASGHDEKEQTLNQLLVELDGFDVSSGVVVLAATNRPEVLDPALLRSGRFDRQVLVDRPDRRGRLDILKVHVKHVKLGDQVDLEQIAALTVGFTGADLANLVNEAALAATRRKASAIELADFTTGMERIIAGLEKRNRLLNPLERKFVAHHEMGHVLVAYALPGGDRVHKVSIIPRGIGSLGYTIQRPTEDRYLMTRLELENKMAVLLGGRAAECLVFNHLSTGASDDIAKATEIARAMVTKYGMEDKLGHASYEPESGSFLGSPAQGFLKPRSYSDTTARDIDSAIKVLVERALKTAMHILTANQTLLIDSAALLLTKESLDEDDLRPILAKVNPYAIPPTLLAPSTEGLAANKTAS